MTKYMVLYRSPISAREQMANTTPEQAEAGMAAWMQWAAQTGSSIVDLGSPLSEATELGSGAGGGDHIGGFSILEAASVEAVTEILSGHPHLGWGGSIEVLEFLPIPGM